MKFRDYVKDRNVFNPIVGLSSSSSSSSSSAILFGLNHVLEIKKEELWIGYSIGKIYFKKSFDYIKSWLIRYKIPYKSINPYFTFAIVNKDPKANKKKMIDNLSREFDKIRKKFIFKPKTVSLMENFIVFEFEKNDEFMNQVSEIFKKYDIKDYRETNFSRIISVSYFDKMLFNDMLFYMPDFIDVKMGNVGILIKNIS